MNIKYIVLFCLTYYIPAVISIEDEEIAYLWNAIKHGENDFINWSDLVGYYKAEGHDFLAVINKFGTISVNERGRKEKRLYLPKFTKAAKLGHIPRWSIPVMRREFNKIASTGKYGPQITVEDIKKYDVEKEYTSEELDDIMTDFGVQTEGERKLFFPGFKRAANTEYFPVIDLNLRLYVLKCHGSDC